MPVDDLQDYGITQMDDSAIAAFLSEESVGVLCLPTADGPVMRPMSFAFDEPSRLYFLYILPADSRKEAATRQADSAEFLVYSAEDRFHWTSVILTGTMSAVPEDERAAVEEQVELGWRPEVLERASESMNTKFYEFEIAEQTGMNHEGLPAGYERRI